LQVAQPIRSLSCHLASPSHGVNYHGNTNRVVFGCQALAIDVQHGSEDHDMVDLSNAFVALQAVGGLPDLRDRKLHGGGTPAGLERVLQA
jgi:hypothetical protein